MSYPDCMQQKIKTIHDCNNAITVISGLLIKFLVDSDCNNEIPEYIKNNYIQSGLLDAIKIAADTSEEAADWLETELSVGVQSDS